MPNTMILGLLTLSEYTVAKLCMKLTSGVLLTHRLREFVTKTLASGPAHCPPQEELVPKLLNFLLPLHAHTKKKILSIHF